VKVIGIVLDNWPMYVFSIDIPFKGSQSLAKIMLKVTAVSYLHCENHRMECGNEPSACGTLRRNCYPAYSTIIQNENQFLSDKTYNFKSADCLSYRAYSPFCGTVPLGYKKEVFTSSQRVSSAQQV
jgi:hypothetical protein